MTTTLTFGITAPLESLTEPVIWPVAVCAPDALAMARNAAITEPSRNTLLMVEFPLFNSGDPTARPHPWDGASLLPAAEP